MAWVVKEEGGGYLSSLCLGMMGLRVHWSDRSLAYRFHDAIAATDALNAVHAFFGYPVARVVRLVPKKKAKK